MDTKNINTNSRSAMLMIKGMKMKKCEDCNNVVDDIKYHICVPSGEGDIEYGEGSEN